MTQTNTCSSSGQVKMVREVEVKGGVKKIAQMSDKDLSRLDEMVRVEVKGEMKI